MTFKELKEMSIIGLYEFILMDEVDSEMIPWLLRFNELPNVLTMESCQGHDEKSKPYIYIIVDSFKRLNLGEDTYFCKEICTVDENFGYTRVYGYHFETETWQKMLKMIYYKVMKEVSKLAR